MAGRGPTILAGRILEQNAWLASSSSSPVAAQGMGQTRMQLSAKKQLQGKASRRKGRPPSTSSLQLPYSCPPPQPQDPMDVDLGTEDAAPEPNTLEAGPSVTEPGVASDATSLTALTAGPSHRAHLPAMGYTGHRWGWG
ncbi:hypothetical protein M378DRAFT_19515 [Amanita muscaria Koide BX008]|uniref:Uncharacterized protein n=1 Tax=Amanita muscaria (strain Koide BX008) TaxID=946122 RepID=A0A0C2RUA4_AMAMK|nr:hypothetical protein M378DRAFT_19515 [Amanita muscaria Koide BX008]